MNIMQQKHTIPVKGQTKPLFGSGLDKTMGYMISDDFIVSAKEDGIIETVDTVKEIAVIKYDSGKTDVIDLSHIIAKNSNGGFYINQCKELLFKEGQRFKREDILAKNPDFFKGQDPRDITYSTGRLTKVAVANLDGTMEDSSMISTTMAEAMTTKMTMKKQVILGTNANVEYMIKNGSAVKTGEPLLIFDTSFEDETINVMLGELEETVEDLTKNKLTCKYTGKIVDIVIYYNHDINEYSESMQKILKKYIKDNKAKNKFISQKLNENSLTLVNVKNVEKINDTKIKGIDVDGVLIEIYIEYEDVLSIGDKVTYGTALKTIICDVFNEGEEPLSEYEEENIIDAIFPPCSLVNRMTLDFFYQLYLNKALLGVKKEIKNIWEN